MKNMKYTQNAFEPKQNSNNRKKEKNKSLNLTSDLLQFNNILILILCMSLLCLFSVLFNTTLIII